MTNGKRWDLRAALEAVEAVYGVSPERVLATTRRKEEAWARHVAFYVLREHGHWTLAHIGSAFGRDHSTVHHGVQRVAGRIAADAAERALVEAVLGDRVAESTGDVRASLAEALRAGREVVRRLEAALDEAERHVLAGAPA